jgi:hypothetical protein
MSLIEKREGIRPLRSITVGHGEIDGHRFKVSITPAGSPVIEFPGEDPYFILPIHEVIGEVMKMRFPEMEIETIVKEVEFDFGK